VEKFGQRENRQELGPRATALGGTAVGGTRARKGAGRKDWADDAGRAEILDVILAPRDHRCR